MARDCRVLYILSGSGSFETTNGYYELWPGTLLYYPYGCPYKIISADGILFYTLNFDFNDANKTVPTMTPQPVKEDVFYALIESIPDELKDCFGAPISFRNASWAEPFLYNIYNEKQNAKSGVSEAQAAYLKVFLIELYRHLTAFASSNTLCDQIKEAVEKDLKTNVKQLAETFNYHPYYLSDVFKKNEGVTLHQYIFQKRLFRASEFITTTRLSLEEIAALCGFSSPSHLSSAFKQFFHMSPNTLRKQI